VRRFSACLGLALLVGGCAYGFTYGGGSPQRDPINARVEPLADLSSEGWPASVVTDRMRERLGQPRGAGAWSVTGEVLAVQGGNIPMYRPGTGVTAGVAVLRVRGVVTVKDAQGRTLLDRAEREGSAEMVLADSVSETEDLRRLALERACKALADALSDAVLAL
jgi:hypothetical protein